MLVPSCISISILMITRWNSSVDLNSMGNSVDLLKLLELQCRCDVVFFTQIKAPRLHACAYFFYLQILSETYFTCFFFSEIVILNSAKLRRSFYYKC